MAGASAARDTPGRSAVTVARTPSGLVRKPRAVAIGTFDGVHGGHRQVLGAALDAGRTPTVVTFDPHPREVFGYRVELISTLDRRLELLADAGIEDVLVVEFTEELAASAPEDFAEAYLREIGAEVVVAGRDFRFGRARAGDLELLRRLGFDARAVPLVEGFSSTTVRQVVHEGDVGAAARLLGRPVEVEGQVVHGDARGGVLGFPTANLRVPPELLVPGYGIYAGAALGRRAAISIGVNPHYGGDERRVEAFLLDFEGDLYGDRLVVEVWQRLRDEARVRERGGARRADRARRRADAVSRAPGYRSARWPSRQCRPQEIPATRNLLRCGKGRGQGTTDARGPEAGALPRLRLGVHEARQGRDRAGESRAVRAAATSAGFRPGSTSRRESSRPRRSAEGLPQYPRLPRALTPPK